MLDHLVFKFFCSQFCQREFFFELGFQVLTLGENLMEAVCTLVSYEPK